LAPDPTARFADMQSFCDALSPLAPDCDLNSAGLTSIVQQLLRIIRAPKEEKTPLLDTVIDTEAKTQNIPLHSQNFSDDQNSFSQNATASYEHDFQPVEKTEIAGSGPAEAEPLLPQKRSKSVYPAFVMLGLITLLIGIGAGWSISKYLSGNSIAPAANSAAQIITQPAQLNEPSASAITAIKSTDPANETSPDATVTSAENLPASSRPNQIIPEKQALRAQPQKVVQPRPIVHQNQPIKNDPLQEPGMLALRVEGPWANVYHKDKLIGQTPISNLSLPPGLYKLRLENPDIKRTKEIEVAITSGQLTRQKVAW
jgi:hypothetical protein